MQSRFQAQEFADQCLADGKARIHEDTQKDLAECERQYAKEMQEAQQEYENIERRLEGIKRKIEKLPVWIPYLFTYHWTTEELISCMRSYKIKVDEDAIRRDRVDGKMYVACDTVQELMKRVHILAYGNAFLVCESIKDLRNGKDRIVEMTPIAGSPNPNYWHVDDVIAYIRSIGMVELVGPFTEHRITGFVLVHCPVQQMFAVMCLPTSLYRDFLTYNEELRRRASMM